MDIAMMGHIDRAQELAQVAGGVWQCWTGAGQQMCVREIRVSPDSLQTIAARQKETLAQAFPDSAITVTDHCPIAIQICIGFSEHTL
jgi:hypothetical protein